MQLTHLCLIMPSDYDKLEPLHATPQTNIKGSQKKVKSRKQHPQGACCGGHVVATLLHGSLTRLCETKWWNNLCQHGTRRKTKQIKSSCVVFHDMEGVQLSSIIGKDSNINHPRIFSYAELYIGSRGFSEEEVLGSGGFGKVYRAVN